MTIALGSLERALEKQPKNNLLFLFQPAEENEAGGMPVSYTHLDVYKRQVSSLLKVKEKMDFTALKPSLKNQLLKMHQVI